MPVTKDHINSLGVMHAGASISLVMLAMEKACNTIGCPISIVSMDINFMRPAVQATIVKAIAYMVHKDSQKASIEGVIINEKKQLVIKASATCLLLGL